MERTYFFHWAWTFGSRDLRDHASAVGWVVSHALRSAGLLPAYVVETYTSPRAGVVDEERHQVRVDRYWSGRAAKRAQRDHVIWEYVLTADNEEVRWARVRRASWFFTEGASQYGIGQMWSVSDLVTAGHRLVWGDGEVRIAVDPALMD
jgi:hypothetical protein